MVKNRNDKAKRNGVIDDRGWEGVGGSRDKVRDGKNSKMKRFRCSPSHDDVSFFVISLRAA